MKIYALGGKARSGKDTSSDYIVKYLEENNKKVCRIQVGQYIKYYAEKYFGWDGREETKPRALLNELGTEIIRNKIDPEFHINRLLQDIKVLSYFYDVFVISDIRFPIEIEKLKSNFDDVVTIRVVRESNELSSLEKVHSTETALDDFNDFDYVIENNSSLEDLEKKVLDIIK